MSDRFSRISIERLFRWILNEEEHDQILGVHKDLFFRPNRDDVFRTKRYGRVLETPLGVAAGPHTQLAQNIIVSWLTGARYIELKTVQTLDELDIAKPCIDMEDEGYNCEWSQELLLADSFDEYLNAWVILYVLKDKFGWSAPDEPGFIFNMSVGYDLAGILKPNVQQFLDKMKDCQPELDAKIEELSGLYHRIKNISIPSRISDNVTLSTMHGCPPEEIEKIGRYLMGERNLHTAIKLNPTLLGPDRVRTILNEKLGFQIEVPDEAFEHDLKYDDALPLIQSLQNCAKKWSVQFGLKLTNTLEAVNNKQVLPENEKMMYLSGRALHPISINLAERLQSDFDGELDITFCAGVDCFNVSDVVACGLEPVTVCTDLLKPGGYSRLRQYLEEIEKNIRSSGAHNIEEFILARDDADENVNRAGLENLKRYAKDVLKHKVYKKAQFPYENIKTARSLTTFDCIKAPCVEACAAEQDVPEYIFHSAQGDYQKALGAILRTNPFPNVTGLVCDHLCGTKCTRINYDNPLLIREIKRFVAENQGGDYALKPTPRSGPCAGIIGAGPSGLACAYFLALDGFEVHVYESKGFPGGMVADAIPNFRLSDESIRKDIESILALGISIHTNTRIDKAGFQELRKQNDYVYIAVGAQRSRRLGIPGENADGVFDQLTFLTATRKGQRVAFGQSIAVIGGGNSAMDAARTARRLAGTSAQITVLYRRSLKEMPANVEEVQELAGEGIRLMQLTAPEEVVAENGRVKSLVCSKTVLGEEDASGRPRPEKVPNSEFELPFDSIVSAIGQEIVLDFVDAECLTIDPVTLETQFANVFAGGDAMRGASSIVNAIGDGKRVAENIKKRALGNYLIPSGEKDKGLSLRDYQMKQARRQYGDSTIYGSRDNRLSFDFSSLVPDEESIKREAERCLYCDEICNICVSVCPNRANVSFAVEQRDFRVPRVVRKGSGIEITDGNTFRIEQKYQILTIGDFCNDCGNCTTFCPTNGSPYRQKPLFYMTEESFERERNGYYLSRGALKFRGDGEVGVLKRTSDAYIYETEDVTATFEGDAFTIQEVQFKKDEINQVDFDRAAEMYFLLESLNDFYLFTLK